MKYAKEHWKLILIAILCISIAILGYYAYTAKPVTFESQTQASTVVGVKLAADNAKITLDSTQLSTISTEIAKATTPNYTVVTDGANATKVIAQEAKKNNADFTIVTNPSAPNVVAEIPKDSTVTLNQYNIQAYKQKIHQVDVDFKDVPKGDFGVNEVTYSESHKISKDGKYLGWKLGYNIEDKRIVTGIRYTW